MRYKLLLILTIIVTTVFTSCDNKPYHFNDNSIVINSADSLKLRLSPYGENMIRVQYALPKDAFFADNHYEMVATHDFDGALNIVEVDTNYEVSVTGNDSLKLIVNKKTLGVDYQYLGQSILKEKEGFSATNKNLNVSFVSDPTEHFTGLGHSYFGRAESLDLKGKLHTRNYGSDAHEQAPLIVPFYMSSKGYGIFMNSTFENYFNFGQDNTYAFGINT